MKYSLAILLLLSSLSSHAALNKWIDADGKVHYSDTTPTDVTVKKIRGSSAPDPITPVSGVSAPKTLAEREAEWKKSQQSKAEAEQKATQKKEEENLKQKNCESSRSNLAGLQNSQIIVKYNEKGERSYLDESARAQRIEETQKAVKNFCN